jgi:hypothetical protein
MKQVLQHLFFEKIRKMPYLNCKKIERINTCL